MTINLTQTRAQRRDPFAEFDAMIRRAFPAERPVAGPQRGGRAVHAVDFTPAAEVFRQGDDAVIRLELPGLDLERDITVELDGRRLVVRGERRDELAASEPADGAVSVDDGSEPAVTRFVSETRYGTFRRSFRVPEHVTAEAVSAEYEAGVLTVRAAGAYVGTELHRIAVTNGASAPAVETVDAGVSADAIEAGSEE